MTSKTGPLVEVRNLAKHFLPGFSIFKKKLAVRAVDGVSFSIARGETLGLVGESGCGKSTTGRMLLRLIEPTRGTICYEGVDFVALSGKELRQRRAECQIIFQDPFSSLNPRMTIDQIIADPMRVHGVPVEERRDRARDLLERVGLPAHLEGRLPHEFSGGQRQRIGIARALALRPNFIVCDEPISALDVSIQAQIVNLLMDLQEELGLTYLFIAHDLEVVRHIADRIAVMYLGKIVEIGPSEEVMGNPQHPYTRALISAIPINHPRDRRPRQILAGDVPSPMNPPSGCRFSTRCPLAFSRCHVEEPAMRSNPEGAHSVACHLHEATTSPQYEPVI